MLDGVLKRGRDPPCALPVVLQQVERHALRRFDADAGKSAQGVDQTLERAFGHGVARRPVRTGISFQEFAACPA
jgi:hypothetical protein